MCCFFWGDWIFLQKAGLQRVREKTSGQLKSHGETKAELPPSLRDASECQWVDLSLLPASFSLSYILSLPLPLSTPFSFLPFLFLPLFLFSFLSFPVSLPLFFPVRLLPFPPSLFLCFFLLFLKKLLSWIALSLQDKRGLLGFRTRGTSLKTKEGGGQEIFLFVSFCWHHHGFGVQVHSQAKLKYIFPFASSCTVSLSSISKGTMKEKQILPLKHGQWKNGGTEAKNPAVVEGDRLVNPPQSDVLLLF